MRNAVCTTIELLAIRGATWTVSIAGLSLIASETKIADDLSKHGRDARDPVWRLPLHRAYRRHLDSRVADIKNAASVQLAGAITAALFLREFVTESERWLHLDVFGWNDNLKAGRPVGGEATGMRALWSLIKDRYARSK